MMSMIISVTEVALASGALMHDANAAQYMINLGVVGSISYLVSLAVVHFMERGQKQLPVGPVQCENLLKSETK